jgi:putative SbcD/Mre11-related phosphoesterase
VSESRIRQRPPILDDWQLTPEGAAIHPGEQTAVIADMHLGYEWARGTAGDCVVAHSLSETIAQLSLVLERGLIRLLVVAGDLVESPRSCMRTHEYIQKLRDWLSGRGVSLLGLEGNHDRRRFEASTMNSATARAVPLTFTVAGWTIGHGHQPIRGERTISGHHHPVLKVDGTPAPCFLVGPGRIVLPAFSRNAAGCDVGRGPVPAEWLKTSLRCFASTGDELLDFGPLSNLRRSLREQLPRQRTRARNG